MAIQIKICGMKFPENISEIALLQPDYLGFIFYGKSPRYFESTIPNIEKSIQKVGVFVNASLEDIQEKVNEHRLDLVQLHGDESPEFCHSLAIKNIKVIKSFNMHNKFNFNTLNNYNKSCDYFLFDTKGNNYGGNGITFDWSILENYHLNKPYFLSGGIGIETSKDIRSFFKKEYSKNCIAIDCNSKLESFPGLKLKEKTRQFLNAIKE